MWREIKKVIHQHQNFLITTHVNPDGDGIGAACALTELLLALGKKVSFTTDAPVPNKFLFLDYHKIYSVYDPTGDYKNVEVMMVLDTHRRDRIGRLSALLENPKMLSVCIDHHLPTEIFTPYTVIDSQACCVGAMIHTLYKEMGHELDLAAATGIYTSIICDTGRFSYSSTSRKAHKIADECMKLGVDPDVMHSKLFQHVSLAEIKMFAKALQRMETHLQDRVVIQQIYREDCDKMIDIEHIDLEYIHEFNKSIEDVKCVVLLRELPHNQVRVSLRSTSNIDVGKPMRKMGGGGHCKAAGATFHGSLEEAKKQVLELLSETLC